MTEIERGVWEGDFAFTFGELAQQLANELQLPTTNVCILDATSLTAKLIAICKGNIRFWDILQLILLFAPLGGRGTEKMNQYRI